jgi:hypothetical protein
MAFVKLDCGILDSTLWPDKAARDVFLTALLMAEPIQTDVPMPEIAIGSLEETGWVVPPGWYGMVEAASVGIIHRAKVDAADGTAALKRLALPEEESRSQDFEGRRMVRVNGGFIILNYFKYRDRDYTAAERSRRWRERQALRRSVTADTTSDTPSRHVTRNITQAEAEAEVEAKAEAVRVHTRTRPAPGPLAGSLTRDHIDHAHCLSRFCVSHKVFADMAKRHGDAVVVLEWLRALDAGLGDKAAGGPLWLLQHFDAWLASTGKLDAPQARTASDRAKLRAWAEARDAAEAEKGAK